MDLQFAVMHGDEKTVLLLVSKGRELASALSQKHGRQQLAIADQLAWAIEVQLVIAVCSTGIAR